MNNLINIIIDQDSEKLLFHLESGWKPEKINAKTGLVTDCTFLTETILKDWADGLSLFYDYFPELITKQSTWDTALNNASIKCIKFLWEKFNFCSDKINQEENKHIKISWLVSIMYGMGSISRNSYDVKNIIPVLDFFKEKEVYLNEYCPGEFEYGDLKLEGHSLFTRSISTRNWDIVNYLWNYPTKKSEWGKWPRLLESIFYLMSVTVEDYKHFTPDINEESISRKPSNEESFFASITEKDNNLPLAANSKKSIFLSKDNNKRYKIIVEKDILTKWLNDFGILWFNQPFDKRFIPPDYKDLNPETLEELLSLPFSEKISPWFRLFLYIHKENRDVLWKIWETHLESQHKGHKNLWLNELSMHPEDNEVVSILKIMKDEKPELFKKYWNEKDNSKLSPAIRWEKLDGEKI